jgi:hypothetical protein
MFVDTSLLKISGLDLGMETSNIALDICQPWSLMWILRTPWRFLMLLPLWTVTPCYFLLPKVRLLLGGGFVLTLKPLMPLNWCEGFCLSDPAILCPCPRLFLLRRNKGQQ